MVGFGNYPPFHRFRKTKLIADFRMDGKGRQTESSGSQGKCKGVNKIHFAFGGQIFPGMEKRTKQMKRDNKLWKSSCPGLSASEDARVLSISQC